MTPLKSLSAAATLLLLAFLLFGCGTTVVDREGAQKAIQEKVEGDLHADFRSTVCPKNEPIKPGVKFTCTLSGADGSSVKATIRMENKKGDLEILKVAGSGG